MNSRPPAAARRVRAEPGDSTMLNRASLSLAPLAASCPAQAPPPPGPAPVLPPPVSPFLNLNRRGASVANNYYNLVRPQTVFYNSIQQLQQQAGTFRQDLTGLEQAQAQGSRQPVLPATGHPVGFMNYGSYFMTMGRAGTLTGYGGRAGGAAIARPPATASATIAAPTAPIAPTAPRR
jgi:hypothetical protein